MNLAATLRRPEGKTLEFKRDLSSPDRFLRAVVAFANGAGGTVRAVSRIGVKLLYDASGVRGACQNSSSNPPTGMKPHCLTRRVRSSPASQ